MDMQKIAPLFAGWEETSIWSCLQGCMGYALTDREEEPRSAQIVVGDFCYFAGEPSEALIRQAGAPILVPRDEGWSRMMERVLGDRAEKQLRYAIRKEPNVFDREKLRAYAESLEPPFTLRLFDRELYDQAAAQAWSRDFCSQFAGFEDYARRGLGVGVLDGNVLVAGASSYTVYHGGIEIQIDTREDYRRRGLATACGAKLILTCLERGLYPSWDAHDLRSVALAEKLGYHRAEPYPVYVV